MSSIFSDPPFVRGRTLASGDFGDAQSDPSRPDVLGSGIVGAVKAFQDVAPGQIAFGGTTATPGAVLSNRLVYCQAVRWRGSTVDDASTIAGQVYLIDTGLENGKPLCQISTVAAEADVAAGREYGVLDEYLTGRLLQNDVVWLVRKGPTAIKTGSASSIADGARVEMSTSGRVVVRSTGTSLGISISGAAVATSGANVRINLVSDDI